MLYDVVIVGAGPAGLSTALYMARFCRSTLVVHDGMSRALKISQTHNLPGFGQGISGPDLLGQMLSHAVRYGASVAQAVIVSAVWRDGAFHLTAADGQSFAGRSLVLATGLQTDSMSIPPDVLTRAIVDGTVRYCPICDGYEHLGQRIAVIGAIERSAGEAVFLRTYSDDVTVLSTGPGDVADEMRDALAERGVSLIHGPVEAIMPTDNGIRIKIGGIGEPLAFDVLYPSEATQPRTALAAGLGVQCVDGGRLPADAVFGTAVPGLFAAGDIVDGLDQISVALGHGAVAATRAHNWLRETDGEALPPNASG